MRAVAAAGAALVYALAAHPTAGFTVTVLGAMVLALLVLELLASEPVVPSIDRARKLRMKPMATAARSSEAPGLVIKTSSSPG